MQEWSNKKMVRIDALPPRLDLTKNQDNKLWGAYSGALTDRSTHKGHGPSMSRQPAAQRKASLAQVTPMRRALDAPIIREAFSPRATMKEYKAPGSPRHQLEMFYIRSNVRGPQEVRLIARQELARGAYQSPSLANATLAMLSPRCGPLASKRTQFENGARSTKNGVHLSNFNSRTIPLAVAEGKSSERRGLKLPPGGDGDQQDSFSGPPSTSSSQMSMDVLASPGRAISPLATSKVLRPTVTGSWPQSRGGPWKQMTKRVRKRNPSYEDVVEDCFGDQSQNISRRTTIRMKNKVIPRLPHQLLYDTLTDISIVSCRLETLPSSFGEYAKNVTSLIIEHNMLEELPNSMSQMTKLKYLGLTANRFEQFPRVISKCTTIEVLSMQGNKLTTVDACVGYLRELRSLYLKGNPLRKLALSIGALQNLHILSYDNAEGMTIPPCQVGKVGHIAVIEWLKIFYHNIVVQFRSELRKNFYTAKAAFNFFDKDRSGQLDKDEVSAALEYLNIDVKYFEYVWLTLDMNNNGVVEWFEFLHNFAANMDETVKDPYIDLKPFLPDEVIQQTAQLLCANPWQTTQFEKVVSI